MLNERIIRDYSMILYIEELNKIHKSKAIFDINDKKTSIILIQLLNNKKEKQAIDLTDCKVVARIKKPDETENINLCTIIDKELGVVAVGITNFDTNSLGTNTIKLEIQSEDQVLVSPGITYEVSGMLFDDSKVNESDNLPILNALIARNTELEKNLLILTKNLESKIKELDALISKAGGANDV